MSRNKPYPKRGRSIDKDRVRDLYLSGPHYDWQDFCAAHKFNPALRSEFPVSSWGTLWLERKTVEQAQLLAPKALGLRGKLAEGRIDVIGQQMETNALLRGLLNENLRALNGGATSPLRSVVAEELAVLAKTNELLIKSEFSTLLMSAKTSAANESSDLVHMGLSRSLDHDEIPEIHIQTVGWSEGLTGAETAAALAQYFDQFEGSRGEPAVNASTHVGRDDPNV